MHPYDRFTAAPYFIPTLELGESSDGAYTAGVITLSDQDFDSPTPGSPLLVSVSAVRPYVDEASESTERTFTDVPEAIAYARSLGFTVTDADALDFTGLAYALT